ncbi:D-glycero-beta-D-manno-heptose-7-phosphate kinase [bacterium]|nr:D-glycero-beta-D-manno-heptose-7-phosphate kinase [bacterium]
MHKDNFRNILYSDRQPKILVVGDIILDKYIWGVVERISPEAPVQVVHVQRENIALGGATNVAHNLAVIGCDVTMLGVIGNDDDGSTLKSELAAKTIRTDGVFVDTQRPTTTKTRVVAGNQQVVRIDHEVADNISQEIENQISAFLKKYIQNFDLVILSDYRKGVLTDKIITDVLSVAKQHHVKTLVDPKRQDFSIYSGATVIKPNLKEAEAAVRRKLKTQDDSYKAIKEIQQKYNAESVILTRGKEGMMVIENDSIAIIPVTAREVFDVTGAGDTVIAYLGLLIASGYSYVEAAKIANVAAGIAVSRVGTTTVSKEEVYHQLEEMTSGSKKILTLQEISSLLPSLRHNKKIVFTNGCFDILHVGHITLLNKARKLGDKLIVGLNSDASIRRIKGEKRPIVSEAERAHILSAIESVDYVVIFDEDTPLELIKAVKPDILVKGSDYTVEKVIGHDVVEAYGGQVALVDLVNGFSTTNIVESILKNYSTVSSDSSEK